MEDKVNKNNKHETDKLHISRPDDKHRQGLYKRQSTVCFSVSDCNCLSEGGQHHKGWVVGGGFWGCHVTPQNVAKVHRHRFSKVSYVNVGLNCHILIPPLLCLCSGSDCCEHCSYPIGFIHFTSFHQWGDFAAPGGRCFLHLFALLLRVSHATQTGALHLQTHFITSCCCLPNVHRFTFVYRISMRDTKFPS